MFQLCYMLSNQNYWLRKWHNQNHSQHIFPLQQWQWLSKYQKGICCNRHHYIDNNYYYKLYIHLHLINYKFCSQHLHIKHKYFQIQQLQRDMLLYSCCYRDSSQCHMKYMQIWILNKSNSYLCILHKYCCLQDNQMDMQLNKYQIRNMGQCLQCHKTDNQLAMLSMFCKQNHSLYNQFHSNKCLLDMMTHKCLNIVYKFHCSLCIRINLLMNIHRNYQLCMSNKKCLR